MKKMGTITKYYPFVDKENQTILNSILDESSSYFDFVKRLGASVVEREASTALSYIAAVQAWWAQHRETMEAIQRKYGEIPCVRPWTHPLTSSLSDQVEYHNVVVEEIEKATVQGLDDWMKTELHLHHASYHWPFHGDIPSFLEPIEEARNLLKANPSLECFEPLLYAYEGWARAREGELEDAFVLLKKGKELALRSDDSIYRYMNLLNEASCSRKYSIQDAISKYEELYDFVQDLRVPYRTSEVLNDSSIAFEAAGEYDLAISGLLETIKIMGGGDTPSLILSRIYSVLGDGQSALEWAQRAFEYAGHLKIPTLYLRKAWALALVNRLGEAERHLETAQSMVLRSGDESLLGQYYHVLGVLERARNNHPTAMDYFEKAQEIQDRYPFFVFQNIAFIELARLEIQLDTRTVDDTNGISPGKWLSRLEQYAIQRGMPGIRMLSALFKSDLYQKHGQLRDAHATLVDALDITDSLGVATLRRRINSRIQEIERLIRGAEQVP
jgi:tetratricopeptide (TPR) repeat protein